MNTNSIFSYLVNKFTRTRIITGTAFITIPFPKNLSDLFTLCEKGIEVVKVEFLWRMIMVTHH